MIDFLRKSAEAGRFELLIDATIFNESAILKAAYHLLDKGYFFFRREGANIVVQAKIKEGIAITSEILLGEYSSALLDFKLRDTLERDNKVIREAIVNAALTNPVDSKNFLSGVSSSGQSQQSTPNQIDFDKDIDQILKEIENDPELKIDQAEIDKILKEIENETQSEIIKPAPILDPKAVADAKKKFQTGQ